MSRFDLKTVRGNEKIGGDEYVFINASPDNPFRIEITSDRKYEISPHQQTKPTKTAIINVYELDQKEKGYFKREKMIGYLDSGFYVLTSPMIGKPGMIYEIIVEVSETGLNIAKAYQRLMYNKIKKEVRN